MKKSFICFTTLFIFLIAYANAVTVEEIIKNTGIKNGLIVHYGCGDGILTAELGKAGNFLVHGLDNNKENIIKARNNIRSKGIYGKVSVEHLNSAFLPYADNMVNLFISENINQISYQEVMRVLAPLGIAYIKDNGKWNKSIKPYPEEMDEWTHFRHSSDGNMSSKDKLAGPPGNLQWTAPPRWQRHHGTVSAHITTVVSSHGRIFYIMDETPTGVSGIPPKYYIAARDAFNGLLLWKKRLKDWGSEAWSYWEEGHAARFNQPLHVRKRMVAYGDYLYITEGFNAPVSVIDGATGNIVRKYEGTEFTDEFVYHKGVLYLSVNDREQKIWPGDGTSPKPIKIEEDSEKRIKAINVGDGRLVWESGIFKGKQAKPDRLGSFKHLTLTVSDGSVFIITDKEVVSLDISTGKIKWSIPRLVNKIETNPLTSAHLYHNLFKENMHNMMYLDGILYVFHPNPAEKTGNLSVKWESEAILQALNSENGEELWRYEAMPINYIDPPDILYAGGLIWIPRKNDKTIVGLETKTGKIIKTYSIEKVLNVTHHHRCYPNKATPDSLILGRRGMEFVNIETGDITLHHWARGTCRYGQMIANGLIYRPPDSCSCYKTMQPRGFLAMSSRKYSDDIKNRFNKKPLEKGSSFRKVNSNNIYANEWPAFRHDIFRSSSIDAAIPDTISNKWQINLKSKLTPPVIADGKLFFFSIDDQLLHVLNSVTGEKIWNYTPGGSVDSPPSVYKGMVLFGCSDGYVYCLDIRNGQLIWKFRGAPSERKIISNGRLESAWPVPGSVLVSDNKVAFTAGRTSLLDEGIFIYILHASTGALVEKKQINEFQSETRTTGKLPKGALYDILISDGKGNLRLRSRDIKLSVKIMPEGRIPYSGKNPLKVDNGFFDDFYFHKAWWNWASIRADIISFDSGKVYCASGANYKRLANVAWYVPEGGTKDRMISADVKRGPQWWLSKVNIRENGYHLYSTARSDLKTRVWDNENFHVCPMSIVATKDKLVIGGYRDKIDINDPWATFEGSTDGLLVILDKKTGEMIKEHILESSPVWNGIAVANSCIYITLKNGSVTCYQ